MVKVIRAVLCVCVCLVTAPLWAQETFVFQDGVAPTPDYAGTQDCHIMSWDDGDQPDGSQSGGSSMLFRHTNPEYPDELGTNAGATEDPDNLYIENPQNTGGMTEMEEGDNDAGGGTNDSKVLLVQFLDLDQAIPPARASEVSNARIGLTFSRLREGDAGDPHPLYVNRVLKRWEQGTSEDFPDGVDTPDNSGAVTWNSTGFELWQAMGAEGPEDVAPTESEIYFDLAEVETLDVVWFDVTQSARLWVADPSANHGVKISQNEYPDGVNRKFLEPDLTLPDGSVVYSSDPVADPTHFVDARMVFFTSEHEFPDERPQLEITLGGSTSVSDWELR